MDFSSIADAFKEYALPISIGGQALSVLARHQADKKVRSRQQQLSQAELERQRAMGEKSRAAFDSSAKVMDPREVAARRAAAEQRIAADIAPPTQVSGVAQNYQQAMADRPEVVGDGIANRLSQAVSAGKEHAQRAALARSFGTARSDTNTLLNRSGEDMGRTARTARRSASVLPYELDAAKMRGGGLRTASDVLGGLSGLAGLYGLTRR